MQEMNMNALLYKKFAITFILFTKEFTILDFSPELEALANVANELKKGADLRNSFWEFVGIDEQLELLLKREKESFSLPIIHKNNIYYNIEIELIMLENGSELFLCSILKKSKIALQYFQKIQKLNKQTLKLQTETEHERKKQDYYDLLNREFISFHVDTEGLITQTNDVFAYFFDSNKEDFLGKHFSEFFYTRDSMLKKEERRIFYAKNALNEEVVFHTDVVPIKQNGVIVENIILCFDITYLKKIEKELEYAVAHDSLTGIANRTLLLKKLDEAIEQSKKEKKQFAVCFIDLNKFKLVNDTYGHHAGDMLLKHIALLLKNFIRENDTVARIGGDEFVILFQDIQQEYLENALNRLEILKEQNPLYYTQEDTIAFDFSLGYSIYPEDGQSAKTLLDFADKKMYKTKKLIHSF